ncbi:hypothetical protein D3Y57_02650 (plasmid) [Sphingomonas paeninsulae]|uniref:ACT domain-containing protein n=1 Tax=Sphingomonas paeninsulae TaxID=2319844 RepID=A0A494TIJ4_SPHPE|nr:hypothetical protein [Sphingomonas paeninsulae]AYJ84975.1 hypothetical protein D3Y57_02650 [Sphingomonas paeninsulae]
MAAFFNIWASADAQILPRLLEYFAQRDLLTSQVSARINGDEMTVLIVTDALSRFQAEVISEKMQQNVLVSRVTLTLAD